MKLNYILSDLQGRILCGVYHIRRLKKAHLRTPVGNVSTYDELKNTFQETNTDFDNALPIISDAVLPQSLVALNCYKTFTCTKLSLSQIYVYMYYTINVLL